MSGRVRVGLALTTAVIAFNLSVGASLACIKVDFSPGVSAGPGGNVPFTIAGTDVGAAYSISVGGTQVADGTDADGGGVSGSFTMPDMGDSARPVEAFARIEHSDEGEPGEWAFTKSIQYVGRQAAQPTESGPTASPGTNSTSPATTPAVQPAPRVERRNAARKPARRRASHPTATRRSSPARAPARTQSESLTRLPVSTAGATRPATVSEGPVAVPQQTVSAAPARRSVNRTKAVPSSTPLLQGRILGPRPARTVRAVRITARPAAAIPASRPLTMWIGGILVLLSGGALIAVFLVRRVGGASAPIPSAMPDPPVRDGALAIEAELQEIVAEDRARKMLDRLRL
jgi:hypothetical protein